MTNSRRHYKQEAYEQAVSFRKRGFTYTEIAKICDVSRGTVSAWLAKEPFSQRVTETNRARSYTANTQRLALVNKARKAERTKKYTEVLKMAELEFKHYRTSPLFVAGISIYESLGDLKDPHTIRLATSKVKMQERFHRFVQEYLGAERESIHIWLQFSNQSDEVFLMKHWSRKLRVSVSQFYKNQIVPTVNERKPALQFGVCNTIIGDTLLKRKLLHWIKLAEKEMRVK